MIQLNKIQHVRAKLFLFWSVHIESVQTTLAPSLLARPFGNQIHDIFT